MAYRTTSVLHVQSRRSNRPVNLPEATAAFPVRRNRLANPHLLSLASNPIQAVATMDISGTSRK